MNANPISHYSQSGAALITALIFLVILTLLAITSMTTTTLEEKMAANTQEANRVFQASETALTRADDDDDVYVPKFKANSCDPDSYTVANIDIGSSYNIELSYSSTFSRYAKPPRGTTPFEAGAAEAYHFDVTGVSETDAASANTLSMGVYQIGPKHTTEC
jgi:hypothetical protein